jgi:hypothetical protein
MQAFDGLQPSLAISGGFDGKTFAFQLKAVQLNNVGFVLDDKNKFAFHI